MAHGVVAFFFLMVIWPLGVDETSSQLSIQVVMSSSELSRLSMYR